MKKKILVSALAMVGATLAYAQAYAGEVDDRWYIVPSLSYVVSDDDRQADNAIGGQLGLGKALSESWNLEISGVADTLDATNNAGSFKQHGLLVDGLYLFDRNSSLSTYAVIGAGALKTTYANTRSTNPFANIGLGIAHTFSEYGLSVRADARYRIDNDDSSIASEQRFGDWVMNLGLVIPIGAAKAAAPIAVAVAAPAVIAAPAPAPAPTPVAPVDSDGDGVIDSKDLCPNTPENAKVNAQGCELDSDGDGVVDSKDRCPSTAHGVRVNEHGCELDRDNDGIVDSQDRCPDSRANAKVDELGCEILEVIVLKGVNFETGSNRLTADSIVILNNAADVLMKRADISVEVAGYTDNRGAAAYNENLSQKRAQAVADYLIQRGVKADKLSAKGHGAAHPVADNNNAAGRAQNRRVELHIQKD